MEEAINAWIFTRTETKELLAALDDEQLSFKPEGDKWQPMYYQFACMIRTQHIYTKALNTGIMDFAYFSDDSFPKKHSLNTKDKLTSAFNATVPLWKDAIATGHDVIWHDEKTSTAGHIYRLIAHERLHHGQLIGYFTLAGISLPHNFKQNWAL